MTTNLWTVGQGIVTGASRADPARSGQAILEDAAEAAQPTADSTAAAEEPKEQKGAAAAGQAQEETRTEMTELRVESEGETVGEAKWAALRELEKLHPGIDKSSVRFQVVSEGERGILGVGYTPARVVATAEPNGEPRRGPASPTRRRWSVS